MRKERKRKALAGVVCGSMLAVALASGTFAYLTSEDSDVNVMTLGNVQIEQNEQERGAGGLDDFTQNQTVVPAVIQDYSSKEDVTVGDYTVKMRDEVSNYVDKIVTVKNTGESGAYVRTIFAFPEAGDFDTTYNASEQWFHWNAVSDTDTSTNNGWIWGRDKVAEWPGNTDNWDVVENVTIDGKTYDLYVVTNKNVVEAGETTAPSLLGFYIDPRVDCDGTNYTFTDANGKVWNLGDISDLKVLVFSQAVQAQGFDDAWAALDEAFGDITKENHPWTDAVVANELGITQAGTYDLEGDIHTVDTGYFHTQNVTDAVTINGNGATVWGMATSADAFRWEGGTIPAMSAIFSSENGSTVTVNDLSFEGTMSSIMLGHYQNATYNNYNTVLNNVDVVGTEVVSFSADISPAVTVYGTATLNNCNIYDTTLSKLDTDPMWPVYDLALCNYTTTTLNNSKVGSVYMWNHASLTIEGNSEVDSILILNKVSAQNFAITVKSGSSVGEIDLSKIAVSYEDNVKIVIEDGATVGAFVDNGVSYDTLDAWKSANN